MAEQLSMFAGENPSVDETPATVTVEADYEALDYQLADLMLELNDFEPEDEQAKQALNKTLRYCTLEISKNTREGKIAKAITPEHSNQLLQTSVTGEAGAYMPLIIDDGYLYLNRYWQYQQRLANHINARIENKEDLSTEQQQWMQTRLADYFKQHKSSSDIDWQKRAVELALVSKFLIVSGGPGTGKTTTITRLLALLIEKYQMESPNDVNASSAKVPKSRGVSLNILLAAPTGKAAIRMLDSIREVGQSLQQALGLAENVLQHMPSQAHTLHKLLGYKPNSVHFIHNRDNPLNADVVLVDEASMIDIALMSKLFEAVPAHAKLILIGDKDQLASVETGSVFADMCQGLKDSQNLISLKKNWRFATDSDIGQCAIAVNQGDSQTLLSVLTDQNRINAELLSPVKVRDADLLKPWNHYFKVLHNPQSSVKEIFDAFNQYRILCALRRGFNGSQTMTARIETALERQTLIKRRRSSNSQSPIGYSQHYHGRPIMITKNSYSRGLYNGDTGISLIRDGELKVYFPAASVSNSEENESVFKSFSPIRLPAHETTWAMTIHKSQGSEFKQVVLILPQEEMSLLTRQLVYTGITRAKEQVSVVASEAVLVAAVNTEVVKATRINTFISQ